MAKDVWRDYQLRKYVRARSAAKALQFSEKLPIIEVIDVKENPSSSNSSEFQVSAVGFQMPQVDEENDG